MGNVIKDSSYYENLGMKTNSIAFKRYKKAGLLEEIDEDFVGEVKQYWKKHYKKEVDPSLPMAFANLTGKKDPRVAYPRLVLDELIPYLNNQMRTLVYKDKNLYDRLIPTEQSVETVLKRMHGLYFDINDGILDKAEVISEIESYKEDMIIKPSDTNDGEGINKIKYKNGSLFLDDQEFTLESAEENYGGDFAVQKVIKQHSVMAAPHPSSVNTLRMVTLRWNNEINYLLTFARFGAGNKVQDNAGAGGVCVGVTDEGKFLDTAIDEAAVVHKIHPTTGFSFKELTEVPNFEVCKQYVLDLHKEITHHDFISWDIAIDTEGQPVFIEANFKGATWLYQLASEEPLFRDFTEEMLEHISKDRNDKNSPRYRRLGVAKKRTNVKKLKERVKILEQQKEELYTKDQEFKKIQGELKAEQNEQKNLLNKVSEIEEKLRKENKELLNERDHYKRKFEDMQQSSSWRVTAPIRKVSSVLKKK